MNPVVAVGLVSAVVGFAGGAIVGKKLTVASVEVELQAVEAKVKSDVKVVITDVDTEIKSIVAGIRAKLASVSIFGIKL